MLRRLTFITLTALLLTPTLATATPCSMDACWSNYYTCVNNPEKRLTRKTLATCNQTQGQCTAECQAEDTEATRRLLLELTAKLTAPQPPTCFVEIPNHRGALVQVDRDRVIGIAQRPRIGNPPASILLLEGSHSMVVEMPIGELAGILETSCPNTTPAFKNPTAVQIPPNLMGPTAAIAAENLEPWITFLVERLAERWPWILEITPQQIRTLSRLLAALLERVIPNQSLHAETGVDIQATIEEVILNTMKPERVQ